MFEERTPAHLNIKNKKDRLLSSQRPLGLLHYSELVDVSGGFVFYLYRVILT